MAWRIKCNVVDYNHRFVVQFLGNVPDLKVRYKDCTYNKKGEELYKERKKPHGPPPSSPPFVPHGSESDRPPSVRVVAGLPLLDMDREPPERGEGCWEGGGPLSWGMKGKHTTSPRDPLAR